MTVNNLPDPSISRTLAALETYRHLVAETARREEELTKDLAKRRYAGERKWQNALKEAEERLTKDSSTADTSFQRRWDATKSFYEARQVRLEKAERSTKRDMPRRVQAARDEWLGALQRRKQRMEKDIASEFAAVEASYTEAVEKLKGQQKRLDELTTRARGILRASWTLHRRVSGADEKAEAGTLEAIDRHLDQAGEGIGRLRSKVPVSLASALPAWLLVPLLAAVAAGLMWGLHLSLPVVAGACGGAAVLIALLHLAALPDLRREGVSVAAALTAARALHKHLRTRAEEEFVLTKQRAQERQVTGAEEIKGKWDQVGSVETQFLQEARLKLKNQVIRIAERIALAEDRKRVHLEEAHTAQAQALEKRMQARVRELDAAHAAECAALDTEEAERWEALETRWRQDSAAAWEHIQALSAAASRHSRPWDANFVESWKPAADFDPVGAFAHLHVDLADCAGALPKDTRLPLPGPEVFTVPLALTFPAEGSLLFETGETAETSAVGTMNHLVLRLLSATPPGQVAFTLLDPVGLGAGFAGLMHLADYEEALINRRLWTQREQIEERLGELTEHIEKVIQMYLRNDFATIAEYNRHAGSVAEKYHFVVVADFPSGFSELAVKRLQNIVTSGPRCGVFTFLHWDQRLPRPDGFVADELRRASVRLERRGAGFILADAPRQEGLTLSLDAPPDSALALELVHRIGKASIDSTRVQVPFSQIAPAAEERWTGDTTSELRVAIGRTGATKQQMLAIGKGTRQHALFAGKTGSGKSTLFHVIITNLALSCSPDAVEFYLIDFKKGVEFKCYATHRLPHARVVAIESDREFALSVLKRVDEELKRRGDLFRKLGVQDVAGYKRTGAAAPMPRTLLIIDEFQEFFVEDDTIAQTASLLFDRIVRQGRAFGIHVLLGSQTLGGAYSLARATLGQMVIRVALQCNEADAYLIMDDGNAAPRLLSRPGEGIYNDAAGAVEGNSPFQVVWLPDDERDEWLHKVQDLARQHGISRGTPVVFEGNAPADVSENDLFTKALEAVPETPPPAGRVWLGAPNAIKGPTEAVFHRQSGSHLLITGQQDEAALNMLALSARALAAQYPPGTAQFYFLHHAAPGTADAEAIAQLAEFMPHGFIEVRVPDAPRVIDELAAEMKTRSSGETAAEQAPAVFVFIHGLHRFKKLRQEDDFRFGSDDAPADTGAQFNDLITEGSALGIHLMVTVDTFNNVNRSLSRKALSEFEMRVVFQMSANDSSSLIDSPAASTLGLHRAIFYNEQAGTLETFRPYAQPPESWWSLEKPGRTDTGKAVAV